MCLASLEPSTITTTSASVAPNTVTHTVTGTTLAPFTGAAAVKKVAVGAFGIAGAVAGMLL